MTTEDFLLRYERHAAELRLPFSVEDALAWIGTSDASPDELENLDSFLYAMVMKKNETAINTLKKLSRIPQKAPLTFENFNMDLLNDKARRQIHSLKNLSFISSKRNVIIVEDHRIQPKQTTYFNQTKYHRFQPKYGRVQSKYDYFLIFGNLGVVPKSTCVTILFFPL